MQRRQEDRPPALNEKSFESLPRMIKSSTRLGVGQFFFRNSGAGGCGLALQMFRVCVFPGASRPRPRASRAKGCLKKLRLFLKTFCFKTFLLASLDGRGDRVSQRCLRGARFARDENLEIFENQKKIEFWFLMDPSTCPCDPGTFCRCLEPWRSWSWGVLAVSTGALRAVVR